MIKKIRAKTILNYVKQPDAWFGMLLRSGQREYLYAKLDELFQGTRRKYEIRYGERYQCQFPMKKSYINYLMKSAKSTVLPKR